MTPDMRKSVQTGCDTRGPAEMRNAPECAMMDPSILEVPVT